jgi:hypothetical protein
VVATFEHHAVVGQETRCFLYQVAATRNIVSNHIARTDRTDRIDYIAHIGRIVHTVHIVHIDRTVHSRHTHQNYSRCSHQEQADFGYIVHTVTLELEAMQTVQVHARQVEVVGLGNWFLLLEEAEVVVQQVEVDLLVEVEHHNGHVDIHNPEKYKLKTLLSLSL